MAERRLRQVEALTGAGQATFLHNRHDQAEMPHFERLRAEGGLVGHGYDRSHSSMIRDRSSRSNDWRDQPMLRMVIPPFVVRIRSSVPPPLIVPRSELLPMRVVATGRSLLIEPFVVEASRSAPVPGGSATSIRPFVVSKRNG